MPMYARPSLSFRHTVSARAIFQMEHDDGIAGSRLMHVDRSSLRDRQHLSDEETQERSVSQPSCVWLSLTE